MPSTPDFKEIRRICHGMMKPEVYERIYATGCASLGSVFVEVGSGHGAGTVCLAKALQDTGRGDGRVFTFDKFEGGSRKPYGNASQNLDITKAALAHFGVSEIVTIIDGDVAETSAHLPDVDIGLLFLDCDGRIDRDFRSFLNRVVVGGSVIIDDCADRVRATDKGGFLRIDQKHRLTHLLVESAVKAGLIEPAGLTNQTWFGIRTDVPVEYWSTTSVIDVYRQIVFANAEMPK